MPEITDSGLGSANPSHTIDADGSTKAAWAQDGGAGINYIWSNRYAAP